MKWGLTVVAVALCAASCGPEPVEPVVEPEGTTAISDVQFVVTFQDTANGSLVASGTVLNTGTVPIGVPWYVAADFYVDAAFTIRLGTGSTEILTPIEPNQSTFWTIEFSSPNVDVYDYPTFYVTNIKAYYPSP